MEMIYKFDGDESANMPMKDHSEEGTPATDESTKMPAEGENTGEEKPAEEGSSEQPAM
ncbi:MAG: hypothetical protein WD898_03045 [Candidatus Paceibacterota bacterium]